MKKMKIKKILKYFGISVAILIIGFLAVAQIAYQSIPQIDPPGKMYTVNGGEIHMYCTGPENDEKPTIIIIPGAAGPSFAYFHLQEKLSETVRTCSYDTAGIGWSKANDIPYTTKNTSNELHQLLQAAQIDGPIILAGHSLGGIVSLIYSAEHEEQVVGIAFIDSSHYNQANHFGKEFTDTVDEEIERQLSNLWLIELASNLGIVNLMNVFNTSGLELDDEQRKMRASIERWNPPYSAMKSMISNFILSFDQGKEAHYDRGNLPIVALSAEGVISENPKEIGGISQEKAKQGWYSFHKDLAELSTNGKHVIVNGTHHMSILDSDETVDHILSLVPLIGEN